MLNLFIAQFVNTALIVLLMNANVFKAQIPCNLISNIYINDKITFHRLYHNWPHPKIKEISIKILAENGTIKLDRKYR